MRKFDVKDLNLRFAYVGLNKLDNLIKPFKDKLPEMKHKEMSCTKYEMLLFGGSIDPSLRIYGSRRRTRLDSLLSIQRGIYDGRCDASRGVP